LGGLWALEWAWHIAESNLRCVRNSGICMPNLNSLALIVSEISAFIRTDRQTDRARSTRLVILFKNIYTLWGRKRFLLPVTYFPTNLVSSKPINLDEESLVSYFVDGTPYSKVPIRELKDEVFIYEKM